MNEKIMIQRLADILVEKANIGQNNAESFLKTFFNLIEETLREEKYVKIKGLGTFKIIEVDSRESVDVNTSERIVIAGHQKITFIPEPALRDVINKPFADFETVILNDGINFDDTSLKEPESVKEEVTDENDETVNEADNKLPEHEEVAESESVDENVNEKETAEESTGKTDIDENQKEEIVEEVKEEKPVNEISTVESPAKEVNEETPVEDKIPFREEVKEQKPVADESMMEEVPVNEVKEDKVVNEDVAANGPEEANNAPVSYSLHFAITLTLLLLVLIGGAIIYFCYPQLLYRQLHPKAVVGDSLINKKVKVASKPTMSLEDSIAMLNNLLTNAERREALIKKDSADAVKSSEDETGQNESVNQENKSKIEKKSDKNVQNEAKQQKQEEKKEQRQQTEKKNKQEKIKTVGGHKVSGTMQTITLQKGETIFSLAKKYYGAKSYWTVIAEYNKNKISNPSDVKAGMKIRLPKIVK